MGRIVSGVWVLLLAIANSAVAQVDDLELTPPADLAPAVSASGVPDSREDSGLGGSSSSQPVESDPAPPTRPRPARLVGKPTIASTATAPPVVGDLPVLFGPAEMPESTPSPRRTDSPRGAPAPPIRESAPRLTLETEPTPPTVIRSKPPADPPLGWRSRWFGRGAVAPSISPSAVANVRPPLTSTAGGTTPTASDSSTDSALKRRVETEIRQAVGSHLRSLEVLVVDRRVIVQASALRFWQRRALRRTIETLPSLAGTRASVHVDD